MPLGCSDHVSVSNKDLEREHTSPNRSALASAFKNSPLLPFSIQFDTLTNRFPVIVTPNSGNTFG